MFASDPRPLILVTNDDGIHAPGIHHLMECLKGIGRIVVVAPDSPRSGHGCSFTCTCPVVLTPVSDDGETTIYTTSGTPVDCVKLALHRLFVHRRPDLIVSGINHGANSSVCVIYSGTMGAAIEGCIVGIPSIGFSLCDCSPEADFSHTTPVVRDLVHKVLKHGLMQGTCLNVNIPTGTLRGVKVCRQADGFWQKEFRRLSSDEGAKETFQVTGEYFNREPDATDTDEYALAAGYVSVVPTRIDFTDHRHIETLRENLENDNHPHTS